MSKSAADLLTFTEEILNGKIPKEILNVIEAVMNALTFNPIDPEQH